MYLASPGDLGRCQRQSGWLSGSREPPPPPAPPPPFSCVYVCVCETRFFNSCWRSFDSCVDRPLLKSNVVVVLNAVRRVEGATERGVGMGEASVLITSVSPSGVTPLSAPCSSHVHFSVRRCVCVCVCARVRMCVCVCV